MRRKDREVTDLREIVKIMEECHVLRLGLADGEYPYIVPVNFWYRVAGHKISLFIHGAMAGRKYELLRKNPRCSFEMDRPLGMECLEEEGAVTMRYQSVMGKATAYFLEGEARQRAIDEVIMARYEQTRQFPYNPRTVEHTAVIRLDVTELTAKANRG